MTLSTSTRFGRDVTSSIGCAILALGIWCGACRPAGDRSARDAGDRAIPPADPRAGLRLDRALYYARRGVRPGERFGFRVVVTFRNPTADTLYLANGYPNDPPIAVVELVGADSALGSAYNEIPVSVGHSGQLAVAPHAVRVDTFRLEGPNSWDSRTGEIDGAFSGLMRLRYGLQRCRGDRACELRGTPLERSSVFRVVAVPKDS